jgi:hypothetical protein
VLSALTGRSLDREAAQLSRGSVAAGIETPADVASGRMLGTTIGNRARAEVLRYTSR